MSAFIFAFFTQYVYIKVVLNNYNAIKLAIKPYIQIGESK